MYIKVLHINSLCTCMIFMYSDGKISQYDNATGYWYYRGGTGLDSGLGHGKSVSVNGRYSAYYTSVFGRYLAKIFISLFLITLLGSFAIITWI